MPEFDRSFAALLEDLSERGLISAGDFEKIQYEMEALQATYDLATLELSYTEIRAPIDGVISERFIKLGNTIDVNAPTFRLRLRPTGPGNRSRSDSAA